MFIKNKWVIVNYKFRGVHCWSNCDVNGVSFLKNMHHHEFEIQVKISVTDSDREFEFIRLQHFIEGVIHNLYPNYNDEKYLKEYNNDMDKIFDTHTNYVPYTANLNNHSCEMIAEDIINVFRKVNPFTSICVSVSEDGHYAGEVRDVVFNSTNKEIVFE